MSVRRLLVLLLSLLAPTAADGQEPTLVVENGRAIVGDGTVLERGSVLVAGERIVSVSERQVEAPGARRIDASGKTVLPGLIDTHVHLLMEELFEQPRTESAMRRFLRVELPGRLRAYTEAGITTVMSPGDYWPFIREVKRRIEAGELAGPRLSIAGPLITAPEGHPVATFCGFLDVGGPNPWCREHLTVEVATASEAHAAVVEAAHRAGLPAYGHIQDPTKAAEAVGLGLDGLVHLPAAAPAETTALDALLDGMRSEAVPVSTTLVIFASFRGIAERQGDDAVAREMAQLMTGMQRTLRRLIESGAEPPPIALGTDAPHLPPAEAYHREIQLVTDVGLTPEQVLRAATADAAVYMGLDEELGTLEAGKLADLVVVGGNPLQGLSALRDVELVVQGGEVAHQRGAARAD